MKTTKKELARLAKLRGEKTFPAPCKKCEEATEHYVSDKKCIPCMRKRQGIRTPQERAQAQAEREAQRRREVDARLALRAAQRDSRQKLAEIRSVLSEAHRELLSEAQAVERETVRLYKKFLRQEARKSQDRHSVYMITNLYTGKAYIGSSVNLSHRWLKHRYQLKQGCHPIEELQEDFDTYGEQAFTFREVFSLAPSLAVWKLRRIEEQYIKSHRGLLYNTHYWLGSIG